MNPIESTLAYTRDMQKFFAEILANFGTKLATWLIVGNAGAAVLAFNASLDHNVCNTPLLRNVSLSFALGLMAAFLASAISYFAGMYASHWLARSVNAITTLSTNEYYIEKLEADGITVDDDAPLRVSIAKAHDDAKRAEAAMHPTWWAVGAAFVTYTLSALCFVNGALLPVVTRGGLNCLPAH